MRRTVGVAWLAACVALAGALAGCSGGGGGAAVSGPQAELSRSRSVWQGRRIASYRYTFRHGCFCAPSTVEPVVIEVRNGASVSVTTLAGDAVDRSLYDGFDTIDKLFALMQATLDNRGKIGSAVYDSQFGLPTDAFLDPLPMAADDELTIEVSDFHVLN